VQSEFALGTPSIGRSDSSWPAHPVLAYLLGGSPNARLDALLREDKGYTYGIRASMRPRVAGGSFVISGSVRSEVTAESLDLILGVVDGAREGFPRAEIAKGVDFITRATPGRWATADAVADETAALAMEGLPWDFQQRTLEAMARLGPDDLASAMAGLAPEGWATVIVADAEQVVPGIEALGVGTVEVVSD
jgi:predicted Zn-dependent peptidase